MLFTQRIPIQEQQTKHLWNIEKSFSDFSDQKIKIHSLCLYRQIICYRDTLTKHKSSCNSTKHLFSRMFLAHKYNFDFYKSF